MHGVHRRHRRVVACNQRAAFVCRRVAYARSAIIAVWYLLLLRFVCPVGLSYSLCKRLSSVSEMHTQAHRHTHTARRIQHAAPCYKYDVRRTSHRIYIHTPRRMTCKKQQLQGVWPGQFNSMSTADAAAAATAVK